MSYRLKGSDREQRLYLGRVGELSLADARAKVLAARQAAADGRDPKANDPRETETFKAAIEKWSAQEQQDRKGLLTADRPQSYVLAVCERWHDLPLGTFTYPDIEDLLATYRRKHPYGANRIHTHLKQMFRWAVRTKRITASPMSEMPPPWLGAKPRSRDGELTLQYQQVSSATRNTPKTPTL